MHVPKPNYESHQKFLQSLANQPCSEWSFKQEPCFMEILENVSKEYGAQYLQNIEADFPMVTFEILRKYVNTNDKYGNASKTIFTTQDKKLLYCSPSSLRYLYHALILVDAFKLSGCRKIIELGAGYGGLCLAVQFVVQLFTDVTIDKYVMIDLPHSCTLIRSYLQVHEEFLTIPYEVMDDYDTISIEYSSNNEYFFVSNYCFSALSLKWQTHYLSHVLENCQHGWVTWQTCFGESINRAMVLLGKPKDSYTIVTEKPQTAPYFIENYWICF